MLVAGATTRRGLGTGAGLAGALLLAGSPAGPVAAVAERPTEVEGYLPAAPGAPGFFEFVPSDKETPAIRAGTISKYRFWMPGAWRRRTVANILSGNYCQPRCDEPWTEVLFEGPGEGSLQVLVSPLNKLRRSALMADQSIEAVGSREGIINALGPNITGNTIEDEEVSRSESVNLDGRTYYHYTLDTPYAKTGQHQLASIVAKDEAVLLLAISATEAQWKSNRDSLIKIQQSFRVL